MIDNPVPWPNNARCAIAITFDMDADSLIHLEHPKTGHRRVSALSMLRYGPEVSIKRILNTYREFDIQQTFYVPAWCIEQYTDVVKTMVDGGHEVAHHGYIHENPNALSREEEMHWLKRGIDVINNVTGQRPRGWRAPLYNFSDNSIDHLIEEGFKYDASLMGDDVPYVLRTDKGQLIELPSYWGMDDWPQFVHSMDLDYMMPIQSPSRGMDVFREEFDAMYKHGGLWVTVWHPFATGRLARWEKVIELIDYMKNKGDVWFARMEDIAAHVQSCIDDGSYTPRIDHLPYYAGPVTY
ncbi:MAG: peptidoglycan/xylan/chitin deacetylase (PgdA/CDA1 family) [Parasphingorhabdus sp.]|jgi:peptidoglycan/xylan/chitin deacetylase (PgdA/CDA1 family)